MQCKYTIHGSLGICMYYWYIISPPFWEIPGRLHILGGRAESRQAPQALPTERPEAQLCERSWRKFMGKDTTKDVGKHSEMWWNMVNYIISIYIYVYIHYINLPCASSCNNLGRVVLFFLSCRFLSFLSRYYQPFSAHPWVCLRRSVICALVKVFLCPRVHPGQLNFHWCHPAWKMMYLLSRTLPESLT